MSDETFLFLDTETTGFKKSGALMQEGQARIVQLALILTDSTGRSLAEYCTLIKPEGWKSGEGALKVHGKTEEMCEKFGVSVKGAIGFYRNMARKATLQIAHNANFDSAILDIENTYFSTDRGEPMWASGTPWYCTMEPNAGLSGGKSLKNCLQHYCQRSLGDNEHDAMFDVKACKDIFFAMRKQKEAA